MRCGCKTVSMLSQNTKNPAEFVEFDEWVKVHFMFQVLIKSDGK
jgi:hypothetical protein